MIYTIILSVCLKRIFVAALLCIDRYRNKMRMVKFYILLITTHDYAVIDILHAWMLVRIIFRILFLTHLNLYNSFNITTRLILCDIYYSVFQLHGTLCVDPRISGINRR